MSFLFENLIKIASIQNAPTDDALKKNNKTKKTMSLTLYSTSSELLNVTVIVFADFFIQKASYFCRCNCAIDENVTLTAMWLKKIPKKITSCQIKSM